jgi:hypothetical protein
MAFAKPDREVRFGGTAGAPTTGEYTEPSSGKKDEGWAIDDEPPSSFWNWLTYQSYKWFRWFNERAFDGATALDWVLQGVDSGAGTDLDGGDLTVSGGDATGDGSSDVTIQAATRGAAGAAARVAEDYIKCDGDALSGPTTRGRVSVSKPTLVSTPSGSDADALTASASAADAHALVITGDPTSPVKSAMRLDNQDTDPSTATPGSIFRHGVTGQLAHRGATRFQNLDSVLGSTPTPSTSIANTATETAFDRKITIPADALRVGTVLKFIASGEFTSTGTPTLEYRFRIGGVAVAVLLGGTVSVAAGWWQAEMTAVVVGIGPTGQCRGSSGVDINDTGITAHQRFVSVNLTTFDTESAVDVEVMAKWSVASVSNTTNMSILIVEVL